MSGSHIYIASRRDGSNFKMFCQMCMVVFSTILVFLDEVDRDPASARTDAAPRHQHSFTPDVSDAPSHFRLGVCDFAEMGIGKEI